MNGFQKFLLGVFSSMIVVFLIWGLVFYSQNQEIFTYSIDRQIYVLKQYHLDLRATFGHFQTMFRQDIGNDFLTTLRSFKDTTEKFNNSGYNVVNNVIALFNGGQYTQFSGGFGQILNALNGLINPIYGVVNSVVTIAYALILVWQLVGCVVNVLWGFYEFLFNPVFIHVDPHIMGLI